MKDFIVEKLNELGIDSSIVFEKYGEKHRFYHNLEHIETLLKDAMFTPLILDDYLFLAIVFHDIIYDPKATDNEEQSAELFKKLYKGKFKKEIAQAILDTKTHTEPSNDISNHLCNLDMAILMSDFSGLLKYENQIFKEYQFVDWKIYQSKRLEFLQEHWETYDLEKLSLYVESRTPNIAVYAGSFNPFHKGHLNILEKAERIFDKVIIARGKNTEKKNKIVDLPDEIQFRQVEEYDGLLTDFIDGLGYDVTLVRGLRNANDLDYEITQYRHLQDLKPDIKVVSIFCDSEFQHVSSSAIRQLMPFSGKTDKYLL